MTYLLIDNISFIDFQDCENELKKYQNSKNINDELILFNISMINLKFLLLNIKFSINQEMNWISKFATI